MTEPIVIKLKSKRLTLEALNSKKKYTKIKGKFDGCLMLYPKAIGRNLDFTSILNGTFEGEYEKYVPDILKKE